MNPLTKLPNIGKVLAEKLNSIGVYSEDDLKALGSENAIIKISTVDGETAPINMLYAIEGAIQGIRWHNLSRARKDELLNFLRLLERGL